jgi:hypothetical protein
MDGSITRRGQPCWYRKVRGLGCLLWRTICAFAVGDNRCAPTTAMHSLPWPELYDVKNILYSGACTVELTLILRSGGRGQHRHQRLVHDRGGNLQDPQPPLPLPPLLRGHTGALPRGESHAMDTPNLF